MIQRIQTLYMLAVEILLIVCLCSPIGRFVSSNGETVGVMNNLTFRNGNDEVLSYSLWALCTIISIVLITTAMAILLYRKRMRQIRFLVFNTILLAGYCIAYIAFVFVFKGQSEDASFTPTLYVAFPVVSMILNWLAIRSIGADEMLVRAVDRIR